MSADICLNKSHGVLNALSANDHIILYGQRNHFQFIGSQKADFPWFKMITRSNLYIRDAACLQIVHILQQPTSCPKPKSKPTTMVNTLKKNYLPPPAGEMEKAVHTTLSSSEGMPEQLRTRLHPSPRGIAQSAIQKEACGRETMRNSHQNICREREINQGLK
jgi:hypothetical protein